MLRTKFKYENKQRAITQKLSKRERIKRRNRRAYKKEKLLVTSNFSFTHSVYKRLIQQTCKIRGLFGDQLIVYLPFQHVSSHRQGDPGDQMLNPIG